MTLLDKSNDLKDRAQGFSAVAEELVESLEGKGVNSKIARLGGRLYDHSVGVEKFSKIGIIASAMISLVPLTWPVTIPVIIVLNDIHTTAHNFNKFKDSKSEQLGTYLGRAISDDQVAKTALKMGGRLAKSMPASIKKKARKIKAVNQVTEVVRSASDSANARSEAERIYNVAFKNTLLLGKIYKVSESYLNKTKDE